MVIKFLSCLSIFIIFLQCTLISAQQATPPAPPGPTNITAILEKAGQFTVLIRLLKASQLADQIDTQLNNSNQGMTIFAPPDNAFSGLQSGTLNSLSDQQKVQLLQFHVLPTFLSMSQFQTVSNPVRTQAGDTGPGEFPLNVITSGNSQVNISTGVNNATVANAIYTDGQLAVYQVDNVLQPLALFGAPVPASAPSPVTSTPKKSPVADTPTSGNEPASPDASGAILLAINGLVATAGIVFLAGIWL
ncbi:hypothetical protein Leryth_013922 [Lithospermum erythrorhizon]|nr:hypothetical protein Leryth_013922 [Lithospermum erythrorhizon]